MRRRSKRAPNLSEQTGKIGQELPANQPAPLQPNYASADYPPSSTPPPQVKSADVKVSGRAKQPPVVGSDLDDVAHESDAAADGATAPFAPEEPVSEGKLILETQPESPSAVPPEVTGAARPPRGFVVLTIGLPGSGKTTWFKRRGVTPLSSDLLRTILFDDITEQRYQGLVFSTLRSLLRARLIARMP